MTAAALFVGDLGLDLTLHVPRLPGADEKVLADRLAEAPGGVVANAAVACARAGVAARAVLRAGTDAASGAALAGMAARGVALEVERAEGPLCRAVVLVEPSGEKRLVLHPGVSMFPGATAVAACPLPPSGWVHTAAYGPAAALLAERCRAAGVRWSVDLEPATFPDGVEGLAGVLRGAAVAFCNARAAARIGPDAARTLHGLGVRAVVLTRGPGGATWHPRDRTGTLAVPAPAGTVVDTTGAGDCLAGWFVAETLRGAAPGAALRRAVVAATLSCGRAGAQASFPTRAEVAAALEEPVPA